MSENMTRKHKLVEEITSTRWFDNPAGRQGYEVVVLEKVGDGGTRFYCSLKPGETLSFSERVFGKYIALAVDMRHARSFPIQSDFNTRERGRKIRLNVNVRYRVTDARTVAMSTVDPLGELHDKVIAALVRELANYSELDITPTRIEHIIYNVGQMPHLGLMVEGSEVLEFDRDTERTSQTLQLENLDHQITVEDRRSRAELRQEDMRHDADLRRREDTHGRIRLTDINVLMHEDPQMRALVFQTFNEREIRLLEARQEMIVPLLNAYIQQKLSNDEPIDPLEMVKIMEDVLRSSSGTALPSGEDTGRIDWGSSQPDKPLLKDSGDPRIVFGDEEDIDLPKDKTSQAPDDDTLIEFDD